MKEFSGIGDVVWNVRPPGKPRPNLRIVERRVRRRDEVLIRKPCRQRETEGGSPETEFEHRNKYLGLGLDLALWPKLAFSFVISLLT